MSFELDNMYCGAIKRGDIFLVAFDGKEQAVAVLQDNILNERLGTIIVVPIEPYKAGQKFFKNEVLLKEKETGFGVAGICMLHKIQPVNRTQMVAKKGELSQQKLQEFYKALDINLGRFRD